MQLSTIDGTDKLYKLMFSEFIRLLLRDRGFGTKAIIHH